MDKIKIDALYTIKFDLESAKKVDNETKKTIICPANMTQIMEGGKLHLCMQSNIPYHLDIITDRYTVKSFEMKLYDYGGEDGMYPEADFEIDGKFIHWENDEEKFNNIVLREGFADEYGEADFDAMNKFLKKHYSKNSRGWDWDLKGIIIDWSGE